MHAWDQGLESLALGRARSAADINGFIHPVVRVDDPARIEFEGSVKSCRCLRSEPELCAVDPHPMKHDGNLAGDSDDGSSPSLGLHQPHAPCLQAAPGNRPHQHRVGGCIERRPHVGVAGMGDPAGIVLLAGLEASRRQPEVSADSARALEAGGIVDCGLEAADAP
jgi:hypothetical protein